MPKHTIKPNKPASRKLSSKKGKKSSRRTRRRMRGGYLLGKKQQFMDWGKQFAAKRCSKSKAYSILAGEMQQYIFYHMTWNPLLNTDYPEGNGTLVFDFKNLGNSLTKLDIKKHITDLIKKYIPGPIGEEIYKMSEPWSENHILTITIVRGIIVSVTLTISNEVKKNYQGLNNGWRHLEIYYYKLYQHGLLVMDSTPVVMDSTPVVMANSSEDER